MQVKSDARILLATEGRGRAGAECLQKTLEGALEEGAGCPLGWGKALPSWAIQHRYVQPCAVGLRRESAQPKRAAACLLERAVQCRQGAELTGGNLGSKGDSWARRRGRGMEAQATGELVNGGTPLELRRLPGLPDGN